MFILKSGMIRRSSKMWFLQSQLWNAIWRGAETHRYRSLPLRQLGAPWIGIHRASLGKCNVNFGHFPSPVGKTYTLNMNRSNTFPHFPHFGGKKQVHFLYLHIIYIYIYTYTLLIYCIFIRIWERTNIPAVSSKLSDKTRASNPPGSVSPWFDSSNLIEIHHFWPKIRLDQIYNPYNEGNTPYITI